VVILIAKKTVMWTVIVLVTMLIMGGCTKEPDSKPAQTSGASVSPEARPVTTLRPHRVKAAGTVEVAFSPNAGAQNMIIRAIGETKKTIKVQAYGFTNPEIAKALIAAHKRGISVQVVLDKSQETEKYSSATFFANSGIKVRIEKEFAIADSKIMIIDAETLITGSYNFTKAAEEKMAENVLVFHGNKELVGLYQENWLWRWNASKDYKRKE